MISIEDGTYCLLNKYSLFQYVIEKKKKVYKKHVYVSNTAGAVFLRRLELLNGK